MIQAAFWTWVGWDALVAIGTLTLALVTFVLVLFTRAGVSAANRAANDARAAAQLPPVMELLRDYQGEELRRCRRVIIRALPACDPKRGLDQLDPTDREAVEKVSNFLDSLGVLVAYDMLRPEPAAAFLGGSALGMWRKVAPFIEAERKANNRSTYQRHFEHLAAVFHGMDYEKRIERLKRMTSIDVSDSEIVALSEQAVVDGANDRPVA